jgi:hypothetical protein
MRSPRRRMMRWECLQNRFNSQFGSDIIGESLLRDFCALSTA